MLCLYSECFHLACLFRYSWVSEWVIAKHNLKNWFSISFQFCKCESCENVFKLRACCSSLSLSWWVYVIFSDKTLYCFKKVIQVFGYYKIIKEILYIFGTSIIGYRDGKALLSTIQNVWSKGYTTVDGNCQALVKILQSLITWHSLM